MRVYGSMVARAVTVDPSWHYTILVNGSLEVEQLTMSYAARMNTSALLTDRLFLAENARLDTHLLTSTGEVKIDSNAWLLVTGEELRVHDLTLAPNAGLYSVRANVTVTGLVTLYPSYLLNCPGEFGLYGGSADWEPYRCTHCQDHVRPSASLRRATRIGTHSCVRTAATKSGRASSPNST